MNYECCSDLIQAIEAENLPKTDATRELIEYYAKARFGIDDKKFDAHFCDGSDDGGIDFFYKAGNTFYIFQTKYSADTNSEAEYVIQQDINKIKNSLEGHNPNIKADEFIQNIKNESGNKLAVLEIIWLTTKVVKDPVRKLVQDDLLSWKKKMSWGLDIDFISIDKYNLDSVIYDVAHGYVPYTGKVLDWKKNKYTMGWKSWVDFIESPRIEKAIRIYSRSAFRLGKEILPKNDEPAAFYKTKNAAQKYNKKVKKQDFINRMNRAYKIFQNEN
jgi:hypothetical protein